jgi:hypothetical protein
MPMSMYFPPARVTSGPTAGYAEQLFPWRTPAAARTCAPWQMEARGLFASAKWRTIFRTSWFRRMYSGARPPGITRAS